MRSPGARIAIGAAGVVAVVVLFIVLAGGNDESGSESATDTAQTSTVTVPAPESIVVRDGKPVGGVQELEFDNGDQVRFVVRSDLADEVHVHGYDRTADVPAGGSARFSFPANIEGVFEIELEGRGEAIAELRVNP